MTGLSRLPRLLLPPGICLFLAACAVSTVNPDVELASSAGLVIPEDELLDIAISGFSPVPTAPDSEDASLTSLTHLRDAEALYTAWQLAGTLKASGHWGMVNVTPEQNSTTDISIAGTIAQSDGQTFRLQVTVTDARGLVWFERQYMQVLDQAYPVNAAPDQIPFQPVLTQLANDVREYAINNLDRQALLTIRNVSRLRFANRFAPNRYGDYLKPAGNGILTTTRLPAANDQIYVDIINIRDRHHDFLDALQQQHAVFVAQVDAPYRDFVRVSYTITNLLNGILSEEIPVPPGPEDIEDPDAIDIDDYKVYRMDGSRAGNTVSRSNSLNSGIRRDLYAKTLGQSGQAFEQQVAPISLEVNDHTVELTGTVEEQYQQWQQILAEMIRLESGSRRGDISDPR